MENSSLFLLSSSVTELYFFFKLSFVIKITIAFLCEHSSMLTSSKINAERNSNYQLNIIISLGLIKCFHFITRMLYI